jgi:hypothetical protein
MSLSLKGYFDYGNLDKLPRYTGTHPAVMKDWIKQFNWKDRLRFTGVRRSLNKMTSKHDRTRYVVISWIEKNILFGARLGEFKNYILLKK